MSLLPLIEDQMRARPDSVAVVHNGRALTYRELQEESCRLAHGLRLAGVQPGSLVAVYLKRSPILLATLLGIWRCGAAYLPLDTTHPPDRTAFMVEDSAVAFIVSQEELLTSVPRTQAMVLDLSALLLDSPAAIAKPDDEPPADSLAYVIYTSGSTGKPKGAKISHGSLAHSIQALQLDLQLQPSDVLLASNSIAFDISGEEYYLPLISGGRVHLVEHEVVADGARLQKVLCEAGITIMIGLSTSYRLLLAAGWQGDAKLQLTVGGETLPLELARMLAERCRALWNHYGPTETSICATSEKIEVDVTRVTLGRPLANVRVYVLDPDLRPVAQGTEGEIYIGGPGVGLGYLHQPELTFRCFLPDPFVNQPGATMYKTGDLGALLPDGRLDFHGRADEQVKIRGFRIELEEIEAALQDCARVQAAVVRAIEFAPDDKRLIAFVVCQPRADAAVFRANLRERLPHYMIPSEYIQLAALPVTPNGKVDRRALDAVRLSSVTDTVPDPVEGDLEADLKSIWRSIFRIGSVLRSDNFFELGGHSVLAVRMLAQIDRRFGIKIPVSILIERPTIAELADYIRHDDHARTSCLVVMQRGQGRAPLFVSHGIGGSLLTFRELAGALGAEQPVYGLRIPASLEAVGGSDPGPELIQRLAAGYVKEIRGVTPQGPYHLAGHSSAGPILVEVARQLREKGGEVGLLAILDADLRGRTAREKPWRNWSAFRGYLQRSREELALRSRIGTRESVRRRIHHHKMKLQLWSVQRFHPITRHFQGSFFVEGYLASALQRFRPDVYRGDAVLFVARQEPRDHDDPTLGWGELIPDRLEVVTLPGGHQTMFVQPHVREFALLLSARLAAENLPHMSADQWIGVER